MRHRKLAVVAVVLANVALADSSRDAPVCPGWGMTGPATASYVAILDHEVRYGGETSLHLASRARQTREFGGVMQSLRADHYRGKRVRYAAFVRTENVVDGAGLWLRADAADGRVQAFDNMMVSRRALKGTREWAEYEVVLDVPESAAGLYFGIVLAGDGAMWVDSARLEEVGPDVAVTSPTGVPLSVNGPALATFPVAPRNLDFEDAAPDSPGA